ncbi:hypothetical protein RHMOL_Rhmol04G0152100 [Rhododendron molle]|uniref:Uncharacterized protein n=1 Tax=Rhododendron molle TaxID=49168 RepID=A0ACC0P0K6_RHOML|nr:hypothetical protein RHMOL_Rhmol04G0152100 [Rhododendron molle]
MKCRRFEKGLHPSIKLLAVSQLIGRFSEIVEYARSVENPVGAHEDVEVWEPKQPTASTSLPLGCSGSQGRKRQWATYFIGKSLSFCQTTNCVSSV